MATGRHRRLPRRGPGLLSGDQPRKPIPGAISFSHRGSLGSPSGLDPGEQVPAGLSGTCGSRDAAHPTQTDAGKSWFYPGYGVLGALSQAGMQDWAFPKRWLIPGAGISARAPCFCCGWHKGVRGRVRAPMDPV